MREADRDRRDCGCSASLLHLATYAVDLMGRHPAVLAQYQQGRVPEDPVQCHLLVDDYVTQEVTAKTSAVGMYYRGWTCDIFRREGGRNNREEV